MKIEESLPLKIKNWSPEDRPREKMIQKGAQVLSDAELIATLIRSGTPGSSAVEISKQLLHRANNNINDLARLSLKDFMKMKGIGEVKALTIMAALELGRRRTDNGDEKPKVSSSMEGFQLIKGDLMDLSHEEFWILLLNRANRLIKKKRVSEGGISGTVADPRIIYKTAIDELASSLIVIHNHPSGNLQPSQSDIDLTKKLNEAGKFLEIKLLDHLIIANQKYFSFADQGMI